MIALKRYQYQYPYCWVLYLFWAYDLSINTPSQVHYCQVQFLRVHHLESMTYSCLHLILWFITSHNFGTFGTFGTSTGGYIQKIWYPVHWVYLNHCACWFTTLLLHCLNFGATYTSRSIDIICTFGVPHIVRQSGLRGWGRILLLPSRAATPQGSCSHKNFVIKWHL